MDTETITASRFLFAFLGGLALNLTPCIYPLIPIPITVSFFAGQAQQRVGRTAVLAICYVLGLAITYSTLGLIASLTGGMLGAALQQPWVPVVLALVVAALGLSLCGLFEFRVPAVFTSRLGTARTGAVGAFVMGLTIGIVAAPCIGPFVLGMLLYVGQLGRPVVGFWLFFALALGLGLPYLFLGIFAGQLHRLPRSGAWLTWVKQVLGCVLFGVALYLVFPLLPDTVGHWAIVVLLIGCGLYLGWVSRADLHGGWLWARRAVGIVLVLIALSVRPSAAVSPSPIAWLPYTASVLNGTSGKPVLVDVYADWCIPCHEMDATTYRDPHVVDHTRAFTMVKLDATELNPTEEAFIERYQVIGVPTLLAFDGQGHERPELRRTGYISADELLGVLQSLQSH